MDIILNLIKWEAFSVFLSSVLQVGFSVVMLLPQVTDVGYFFICQNVSLF